MSSLSLRLWGGWSTCITGDEVSRVITQGLARFVSGLVGGHERGVRRGLLRSRWLGGREAGIPFNPVVFVAGYLLYRVSILSLLLDAAYALEDDEMVSFRN